MDGGDTSSKRKRRKSKSAAALVVSGAIVAACPVTPAESEQIAYAKGPRKWIADIGSGIDVIGKNDLSKEEIKSAHLIDKALQLSIAGGSIVAKTACSFNHADIDGEFDALVVPSSPPVKFVGKRCKVAWGM